MRISLGDVSLWFDVSGPSVIPQGDTTAELPVLVAVHGGPGLDHMTVKSALQPLAADFQVLYFDLRGHGRSDRSSAEFWNMRTWADDLRRLCDALGLRKPVILGSSFGGEVALTYAALFPDHPGAVILANTTGGHWGGPPVIEAFGRLGGPEAAAIIERIYAKDPEDLQAEFNRVCYPLYSATPGWAEESRQFLARMIRNPDVASHYASHEVSSFDPWSLLGAVRCPILVLAGEDDPVCPLPVVEELASQLPADTTRLVRLPGARHTIFRDRPDLAFPAVKTFFAQIRKATPLAEPRWRPGRLDHSPPGPAHCADRPPLAMALLPLILTTERDPTGGVQVEPRCSDRCSGSRSIGQKNLIPARDCVRIVWCPPATGSEGSWLCPVLRAGAQSRGTGRVIRISAAACWASPSSHFVPVTWVISSERRHVAAGLLR